jgi:uncharacterized protein (UPF0276 family)
MKLCIGVNPRELLLPDIRRFAERPDFDSITVSIDDDLGGLELAQEFAARRGVPFGLHLTSVNMSYVESAGERLFFDMVSRLRGCGASWLVQDIGTYSFPGLYKPPFVAAVFDEEVVRLSSEKARRIEAACGIEVLLENPPILCRAGDLTVAQVFRQLQDMGHDVAVDLAHWLSYYVRTGGDPVAELALLDLDRVAEFHVSGGAITQRGGERFYVDVHSDAKVDAALVDLYGAAVAMRPGMRVVLEIFGANRVGALEHQLDAVAAPAELVA